jgi:uncharacterized protein YaiI (UPF0178 family)
MSKKIEFKDILTKVTKIFKTDFYILHNKYILGGNDSEEENNGTFLVVLNEEAVECVQKQFNTNDIIYIKDGKKAKTELDKYVSVITDTGNNNKEDLLKRVLNYVNSSTNWDSFILTEEESNNLFKEGILYKLFDNDKDIPTLLIGKKAFPGILKAEIANIVYHLFKPDKDEIFRVLFRYHDAISTVYEIIQFIDYKK